MKYYIFLLAIGVMVFMVSCDELKEKIEVGFRTNIEAEIPIKTQNAMTVDVKSVQVASDVYNFIGGGSFSLTDIPELKKYMNNLRSIVAEEGSVVRFTGAAEGNKILSLKLKFGIQITPGTEPPMITAFNHTGELLANAGEISFISDAWTPLLIGALEANRDKVFIISVEGTSNYSINSVVKIKIPVKITATPLD
jgi:hypothetical protein